MNLEVDVIPVSDVERSKQFYQLLGWRLDVDDTSAKTLASFSSRPKGSGCSVTFGNGLTAAAPGSAAAALIVSDIEAAHDEFIRRGIDASGIWHGAPFPPEARLPGRDPKRTSYGSSLPSMIPTVIRGWSRRSQRGPPAASIPRRRAFAPANDLSSAMRRAAAAHGEHEKHNGHSDTNWPDWYAAYMAADQTGTKLPM